MHTFPTPNHQLLNVFAGEWHTTGEVKATSSTPALPIEGTDIYSWLDGGYFLVHRVSVKIGDSTSNSIEVIGYDETSNSYTMHAFDDQGNQTEMTADVKNNRWTFTGKTMRFTGSPSGDEKTISGKWELLKSGNWQHWMDIKLTKK